MMNEPTTADLNALEAAELQGSPEDIYSELQADDYADAIMADLGISSDRALFGEF